MKVYLFLVVFCGSLTLGWAAGSAEVISASATYRYSSVVGLGSWSCSWSHDESLGPLFEAPDVNYEDCVSDWTMGVTSDGIYATSFGVGADHIPMSVTQYIEEDLTVSATFADSVSAVVTVELVGEISTALLRVFMTSASGESQVLTSEDPGALNAVFVAEPGEYQFVVEVSITQHSSYSTESGNYFPPFSTALAVDWSETGMVSEGGTSWGQLKAMYR